MDSVLPISVSNLRFEVAGKCLINIVKLSLNRTGPCLVLGPNGAGKSLLLRLMHGLISPTTGSVDYTQAARQSMVFQRPVLLRRSVAANVAYALKAHNVEGDVAGMLDLAGLADKTNQAARSLSGGEQQLLAVVRALAISPQVLFLDEPTSSLDPNATQRIEKLILGAVEAGTKVIMVSHDIGQAKRLAQEVLFCHQGRIIEHRVAEDFFMAPQSDPAKTFLAGGLVT